jgi:hypothetical protein
LRVFLGILIGIAIVFNWSTIRTFFDGAKQADASAPAAAATAPVPMPASTAAQPAISSGPAPNSHEDLSRSTEQRLKDIAAGK